MTTNAATRRMIGGHALVECLLNERVRYLFNVPGESFTSIMDGVRESERIRLITNRQEGGACYMAEAWAKATREVGVCVVTRGPGATNASIAVHCARQDSTPLVLLVGQVNRANRGRESLQEIDYHRFFGSIAKWVVEIDDPRKVPQVVSRAFHVARSGRPGPVVVSLPRDMLDEAAEITMVDPYPPALSHPDPALVREWVERIGRAERPVLIAGSGVQYARAGAALVAFCERFQVPVISTYRRLDVFPNDHAHYVGNLSSADTNARKVVRESDLVIAIGSRMTQPTTANYTLPMPGQPFIQIHADEETIGQNARPTLAIVADARRALEAALALPAPAPSAARAAWIAGHRAIQARYSVPPERPSPRVSMERVMRDLRAALPRDAIHTVDAGNFALWVHRYIEFTSEDSFLGPTVGSMGYGVPAAIAAKLAHPHRAVIAHCGDGGFLMTGQELATAAQFNVPIVTLVYNNRAYGTIRMHQEKQFPGRPSGTDMVSPDFATLARGYGALGFKVERDDDFMPALREALASHRPALIEVSTDLEMLSPTATLTEVTAGKPGR